MKAVRQLLSVAAILAAFSLTASADDSKKESEANKPVELKNQTHCPVMGGKIDSTVYTDIQGQRVYHCCPMCSAKLKADPDKYFKDAAAQGILFENIQTTCPVSGKELKDKSHYVDFEGRRVAFCCDDCVAMFKKDPAKYIERLGGKATQDNESQETDHQGHSH